MPIHCDQRPSGRKYARRAEWASPLFHFSLYVYSIQIFTLSSLGTLDECSNVRSMQFDEADAVYAIQAE